MIFQHNQNDLTPTLRLGRFAVRRGAYVLEFAVVVPVFFVFVFGLLELGRGLMSAHLLNNAAREGCRSGIIAGTSTADITSNVDKKLTAQGIANATVKVTVNDKESDAASAQSGDKITVAVFVSADEVTWFPGAGYLAGDLVGKYTLRRE